MKEQNGVTLRYLNSLLVGKKAKGRPREKKRKGDRPLEIKRCVVTAGGTKLYDWKV